MKCLDHHFQLKDLFRKRFNLCIDVLIVALTLGFGCSDSSVSDMDNEKGAEAAAKAYISSINAGDSKNAFKREIFQIPNKDELLELYFPSEASLFKKLKSNLSKHWLDVVESEIESLKELNYESYSTNLSNYLTDHKYLFVESFGIRHKKKFDVFSFKLKIKTSKKPEYHTIRMRYFNCKDKVNRWLIISASGFNRPIWLEQIKPLRNLLHQLEKDHNEEIKRLLSQNKKLEKQRKLDAEKERKLAHEIQLEKIKQDGIEKKKKAELAIYELKIREAKEKQKKEELRKKNEDLENIKRELARKLKEPQKYTDVYLKTIREEAYKEGKVPWEDKKNNRLLRVEKNEFDKIYKKFSFRVNEEGQVLKEGRENLFYPTGEVKSKGFFKSGERHGVFQSFYKSGFPKSIVKYQYGEKVSIERTFFENTEIQSQAYYYDGNDRSVFKLKSEEQPDYGQKHGAYLIYFSDGSRKETGAYRRDRKEGIVWTYFKDGRKKGKYLYKKGRRDGPFFENYTNGRVHFSGGYTLGKKDYRKYSWKEFDRKGKMIRTLKK